MPTAPAPVDQKKIRWRKRGRHEVFHLRRCVGTLDRNESLATRSISRRESPSRLSLKTVEHVLLYNISELCLMAS